MSNIAFSILRQILRSVYGILNVLAIVWLFACLFSGFYDTSKHPSIWSLVSFSSLFAVVANFVFVIIWLFSKKKKYALASAITLLLCWKVTFVVLGFNLLTPDASATDEQSIKIMSWNVHMFDLGEWTKDKSTFAKMLKLIEEEDPDILCMQEYYRDAKDYSAPYAAIIRGLGYGYESFMINGQWNKSKMTINAKPGDVIDVGTVIYSKYPITAKHYRKMPGNGQGMHTVDIELKSGKKMALTTLHLTSFQLDDDDIGYIDGIKTQGMDAAQKSASKGLIKKLMNASSNRAAVANAVAEKYDLSEYPMVVCGDLNDMPGSYVYNKIKGNKADAFISKGLGVGNTYQKILPLLRIDYLFYDQDFFEAKSFKKADLGLSDHYPIFVNLKIK